MTLPASYVSTLLNLYTSPDRGVATIRSETHNQFGEIVQVVTGKLVMPRRTSTTALTEEDV
jgi:hypothetical protein